MIQNILTIGKSSSGLMPYLDIITLEIISLGEVKPQSATIPFTLLGKLNSLASKIVVAPIEIPFNIISSISG